MTRRLLEAVPDQTALAATFAELRARGPVLEVEIECGLRVWVVTSHAEGRRVLVDPRFVKDLRALSGTDHQFTGRRHPEDSYVVEGRHMLNSDGADHVRLRKVVAPLLSAAAVAGRAAEMESIATRLLAGLPGTAATSPTASEPVDLVATYTRPLPALVMGRVIGVDDGSALRMAELSGRLGSREDPASREMRRTYVDLVGLVRDEMGRDHPDGSVLAALTTAVRDGVITRRELVSTVLMLLGAGTSSSTIALSHGVATIAGTAALSPRLPHDEKQLVEELLRQHPPFPFSPWRFASQDVEVAGTVIPAGSVVLVLLATANLDSGDPHLTFGRGPHYCVGAHLARAELAIGLRTLFTRFPGLRLAVQRDALVWNGLLFDRTITRLPVRFRPRSTA